MTIQSVCVYCGSSAGTNGIYTQEAAKLGQTFNRLNWRLVYGGGNLGLMGTVAQNTLGPKLNGNVNGIIPTALFNKERKDDVGDANADLAQEKKEWIDFCKTTVVPDMHTRKRMMAQESDAFVAMPGGFGTFEEIMECITWSQLGIHDKPIVLFNIDGFYDSLINFIREAINEGFISEKNGEIIQVAHTVEEVVNKIINYKTPDGRFILNWDDDCKEH